MIARQLDNIILKKNIRSRPVRYKEHMVMFSIRHMVKDAIVVESKTQQKKIKKSTWFFLLCNILIVGAILAYSLITQGIKPISELLAQKPMYRFFFVALLIVCAIYLIEGVSYSILLKKTTGKFNFFLGLKIGIIGKYWDHIKPIGSGGHVTQITYANSRGCPGDAATSIVIVKYLSHHTAFLILGIVALAMPFNLFGSEVIIKYLATAVVVINLAIMAFIFLVSVSKKACSLLVVGGLKVLRKLKLIKNYRKSLAKSLHFIREYQRYMRAFARNPFIILSELLLNSLSLILTSMLAYCVYLMFYPNGIENGIKIITMSFICSFALSIVPIPGDSVVAEMSFVAMFSKLFTEGTTFWAVLLWRILTFYIFIIVGFVFTMVEPFTTRRKNDALLERADKTHQKAIVVDENIDADIVE